MKAKFITLLLAVLCIILCFAACEEKHFHTVVIDAEISATCTKNGLTRGEHCPVCNEILVAQAEIKAPGHIEVIDEAKDPTCTEDGWTEGKHCSVCNEILVAQAEIKAPGHIEVIDEAKDPTCTEDGWTEGKHCSVCNKVLVAQDVLVASHDIVIDKAIAPTSYSEGLTEGQHCGVCGEILVAQQKIEMLPATWKEVSFGHVTTEEYLLTTDYLKLRIDPNVYVPGDLVENINLVLSVMETVSGMKFRANPHYDRGLLEAKVEKPMGTESERGNAYAWSTGMLISSGDLVNLYALIHESSHVLQYQQSTWSYCQWAMEGISTYTTYKTQEYIAQHYPALIPLVGTTNSSMINFGISKYNELYKYPLEYWMENTFVFGGNENYSIGFRLMWYLDEVYGDYTKWIYEYEKVNPFYLANAQDNSCPVEEQIKAFKLAYGEDVFDGFYPWLKNNEALFGQYNPVDLSGADKLEIYPQCEDMSILYELVAYGGSYKDLCIDVDVGRCYLSEYKNKNTDGLAVEIFTVDSSPVIELYDCDGRLLRTEVQPINGSISLDGVSYIKLVGEGALYYVRFSGFEGYGK